MPQRKKLNNTQLRPKDRDLKDPRREEKEREKTPSVSVRYCFECIEKHLQKAHGLMGEARDFWERRKHRNRREHAWASQKNIALVENHIKNGPKEIREKLGDEKEVLSLLRKMIHKSRIAWLAPVEPRKVTLGERELGPPELMDEVRVGLYNTMMNLYKKAAEELK